MYVFTGGLTEQYKYASRTGRRRCGENRLLREVEAPRHALTRCTGNYEVTD